MRGRCGWAGRSCSGMLRDQQLSGLLRARDKWVLLGGCRPPFCRSCVKPDCGTGAEMCLASGGQPAWSLCPLFWALPVPPPTSLGEVRALDSEDIGVEGLQWPPAGPSVLAPCWPEGRGAEGLGNDNVSAGGVARRQCLFTPGGPQSLPGFLGCSWHPFLQPSGGPTPASVFPRVVPIVLLVTDSVGFTGGLDQWVKGPVQCMVGRGEGPKDPCACPPSRPQLLRACRPPLGPQPWPACEVCGLGHMTERGSG